MNTTTRANVTAGPADHVVMTAEDVHRLEKVLRGVEGPQNSLYGYAQALKREMRLAAVVGQHEVPADVVTMNSRVRVRDVETGEVDEYVLAYPCEASFVEGGLSVLAPAGTALLGARVGDVVTWRAPRGRGGQERALEVEAVVFQPEAEGKFDL